jgi:hypothetical protein
MSDKWLKRTSDCGKKDDRIATESRAAGGGELGEKCRRGIREFVCKGGLYVHVAFSWECVSHLLFSGCWRPGGQVGRRDIRRPQVVKDCRVRDVVSGKLAKLDVARMSLARSCPACCFLHRKGQEGYDVCSIATPNERCRSLEMAQQLGRSGRFARGRRGKSTRQYPQRAPFDRVWHIYGT